MLSFFQPEKKRHEQRLYLDSPPPLLLNYLFYIFWFHLDKHVFLPSYKSQNTLSTALREL